MNSVAYLRNSNHKNAIKVEVKRLTNKIIIPTDNQEGINAPLAEHFGRAPYFTVVEFDSKGEVTNVNAVQTSVNTSEEQDHRMITSPNYNLQL